ncbi:MAG TPA: hypothetical protein VLL95_00565 [Phnomibacter sp.]|nr:hypothetical protein [Phnomibacter sp.]
MQQTLKTNSARVALLLLAGLVTLIIYAPFRSQAQQKQPAKAGQQQDTTRRKSAAHGHTHKTYESLAEDLADAARQLETEMKKLQEVELPKMQAEMQKALKELDAAKLKAEIDKSVELADLAGIQREIEASMKQVQQVEMQKALKAQLAAIDFQKLQQEMQELKTKHAASIEKEMAQARKEMEKNSLNLEETMKDAKRQMQAAQAEIEQMKKGIDELIKDGIVKKDEPAEIEWEGDTLIINGKRQPAEVSKKYEAYFRKGKFSFNGKSPKIVL